MNLTVNSSLGRAADYSNEVQDRLMYEESRRLEREGKPI